MEEKSKNSVENRVRPQNKHLKPFKKGDPSPNPKGRGKGTLNYATLRNLAIIELAKQNKKTPQQIDVEIMANALLEARKGNFSFYKDDKDRVFGTSIQRSDLTSGGKPIPLFDNVKNNVPDNHSDTEDTPTE